MPCLLFPGGPAAPSGVDIAAVIQDILPALGATSQADLDWCTQAELYQFADEANKRLAARVGVWVDRYAWQTVTTGQPSLAAPLGHVDTIHVSWNGSPLRPTSVRELEGLDASYSTTEAAVPDRFSMDLGAPGTITVYPINTMVGTAEVIFHRFQPQIALGNSLVPIPSPLQDYFGYSMLAEARRKESDAAMPDMADHFAQRVSLFEQVLTQYFGETE
jgi:hypothetical protein